MPTNLQPYRANDVWKSFEAYQFSDVRTPTESSHTYQASDAPQSPGSYSDQVEDTPQSPKTYSYQVNDMPQPTETYQWYIEFHGRKITSYSVFNRMFYQYLPSTIGKTNDGRWMCAYESEEACNYWLQWAQDEDYDGDLFTG
ncbi:Protein of unknown function [Pyronema omphalodes CBS 100304]|uniref:Uncharacterized protein n=1 Tax=Pyronema omphalodes (strain CBS 100304) TaxID=1076935 RepID=U4KWZ8_PYROM|nr:Protein of unknown function [Pyronema omphalodes CBS 100304]